MIGYIPAMPIRIGDKVLHTVFFWPSGTAAAVLTTSENAMGAARAKMAAALGDPDPFHVRRALAAAPDAKVSGCDGRPLSRDAVDAVLLDCPAMVGVLAFQKLGPIARSVVRDRPWLRWPRPPISPLRTSKPRYLSTRDLGDDERATFRCIVALPRGRVAIGSDYGLAIGNLQGFQPFPWPAGARRENRRVEAMLATDTSLLIGTQQALFTWDYRSEPHAKKYPADSDGGYDDLLAMAPGPLTAWRTRLEGGVGPPDILAFASDPNGVTYAGTRTGEVWVVNGGGPIRTFATERVLREGPDGVAARPVRHLAWADGHLWVAAGGELHRFDGASWASEPGEPGALASDEAGRLWMVRGGQVWVREGGTDRVIDVAVSRPWALCGVPGGMWVGGVGSVGFVPT